MLTEVDLKKLAWHSRRGMLELDLLLLPFVENRLRTLSHEQQLLYRRLLQEEDQDLFVLLVERATHPDPQLQELVVLIKDYAAGEGRGSRV